MGEDYEALRLAVEAEEALRIPGGVPLALALAIESMSAAHTAAGDRVLRRALARQPRVVTRVPHSGDGVSLRFSPDRRRLVVSGQHGPGLLIDVETGEELARVDAGTHNAMVLSPDGAWVSGYAEGTTGRVYLFDAETGAERVRPELDLSPSRPFFDADGRWLALGELDGRRVLVDLRDGKTTRLYRAAREWNRGVTFSADGASLVVGVGSRLLVFDTATGDRRAAFRYRESAWDLAFAPDGSRVAIAGGDVVQIFDVESGTELGTVACSGGVFGSVFSADGTRIAVKAEPHQVLVHDVASGTRLARVGHGDMVWTTVFSPDGRTLATGSGDEPGRGWLTLVDVDSGVEFAAFRHLDGVSRVVFSPRGTRVATALGREIRVFDTRPGTEIARIFADADADADAGVESFVFGGEDHLALAHDGAVEVVAVPTGCERARSTAGQGAQIRALSGDGSRIVADDYDWSNVFAVRTSEVWVLDAATGSEIARRSLSRAWAAALSRAGNRLVTGEMAVQVFDVDPGGTLVWLRWPFSYESAVTAVALSAAGETVAVGTRDGRLQLVDVASREKMAELVGKRAVNGLAFLDDRRVLCVDELGTVRILTPDGELRLPDHERAVRLAASADGTRLATVTGVPDEREATVRVFDSATGAELLRVEHDGGVGAVALDPAGEVLAWVECTFGADPVVRLVDAGTGRWRGAIDVDALVVELAFTADGTELVAALSDATVRTYEVDPAALLERVIAVAPRWLTPRERLRYGLATE